MSASPKILEPGAPITLQDVLQRVGDDPTLSISRKRDLRSAIVSFGKLTDRYPQAIRLDLKAIRKTLDGTIPQRAKISRKRWANLRSDLAAAIDASGLNPMLRTSGVELGSSWVRVFGKVSDQGVLSGLSRLARWASLRQLTPHDIDDAVIARFIADIESGTLLRFIEQQPRSVTKSWNGLVRLRPNENLKSVGIPCKKSRVGRVSWETLPASLRQEVEDYLRWCSVPDRLDDNSRVTPLSAKTIDLHRDYIHSAASTAVAAGIDLNSLTSLARLVEPEIFRSVLRQRLKDNNGELAAYTLGLAVALITIAKSWVRVTPEVLTTLKTLRTKLGTLRRGLTEKNKSFLRVFDNPKLLRNLIGLPEKIWRAWHVGRGSRHAFAELQSGLAIDIYLHAPVRSANLASLLFDKQLYWPEGKEGSARIEFDYEKTKNGVPLCFDLPVELSKRLWLYRNEIIPAVTGQNSPEAVFVKLDGKPRTQGAIAVAIEKTIFEHLGVKMTSHQFRHLAAKIMLDANPGALNMVREFLGQKNIKTTTNYYAGIDTRRAGRVQAATIAKIKDFTTVKREETFD